LSILSQACTAVFVNINSNILLFISVVVKHIFAERVTKLKMFIECRCKHFVSFKYHWILPLKKSWQAQH